MSDGLGRIGRVLVLGGGSGIAQATVRELLGRGRLSVVLAARRPGELDVADLAGLGASIELVEFDASRTDTHAAALDPVFEREDVDLVVLAFGVLDGLVADVASTNFTGAASALQLVTDRLARQGRGTVVVLSSVAALRPRGSNYLYGATKAGLDFLARGLQLRSAETGVRVIVVRPGFVRTRMTAGLDPAPLAVGPEAVARAIVRALTSGDDIVWVPRVIRYAMWLVRILPRGVVARM